MAQLHPSTTVPGEQDPRFVLRHILDLVDAQALLDRLWECRQRSRPGYPLRSLWRAYLASFVLNLPHTNALIRALEEDRNLRELCEFGDALPHRTTFNRFIQRLSHHADLVDDCITQLIMRLKELLPDLGEEVAIDSTTVRTHCNPNRRRVSDLEASWTKKPRARAREGKEWAHGYKLHMIADANHGVALAQYITTASVADTKELQPLVNAAEATLPWFKPKALMADRGYDSQGNHDALYARGILPIIKMRRPTGGGDQGKRLHQGIYTSAGVPTCLGQVPMEYVGSDPEKGYLYRCRGCHLKDSRTGLFPHCIDEVWVDPKENIRLFGVIRRKSPEWRELYNKRQAIERLFKSLKENRRLERHCVRGLRQVALHSLMSVLSYQATVLANLLSRNPSLMRWMVSPVT